jgi:hypothetical protein
MRAAVVGIGIMRQQEWAAPHRNPRSSARPQPVRQRLDIDGEPLPELTVNTSRSYQKNQVRTMLRDTPTATCDIKILGRAGLKPVIQLLGMPSDRTARRN